MAATREHLLHGIQGIHPKTKEPCTFYMDEHDYFQALEDADWIFDDYSDFLEPILNLRPHGIVFHDLKREEYNDAWGMACKPDGAPQPGVALVFVHESSAFKGPVILAIEWREEDTDMPGHPAHWQEDFGGILWSQ
jgi:hypothetical protein